MLDGFNPSALNGTSWVGVFKALALNGGCLGGCFQGAGLE